ncbi:MAG: ABC transporter substrate-binding protein, partial [Dehalococcoidia bacterium]|nr:ABC transporter substrate-binding protein [Dehalococcoidia bacterium]
MKKRNLITILVMVLSIATITALLAACAGPAAPAAVKELKVGFITPSTGPAAEKGAPGGHGILDCVEYINTELGGVSGYKIKPLWYDSGYDMARVVTIVKSLMDQGALLF